MDPVLRITGRGAPLLTLSGLSTEQARALREVLEPTEAGARRDDELPTPLTPVVRGTVEELKRAARVLGTRDLFPFDLSRKIDSLLDNYLRSDYKIDCRGKTLDLGSRTHVMGVLNVTPDSFSDGGLYRSAERALAHAREMTAQGADIIDIGGESTRPGAEPVPEEEELRRIIPLIEKLSSELPVPLSVDTYKSTVARKALQAGASMVNDISGLRFSPDMAKVAADFGAAVVIMHIKGTPRNMQQNPVYHDVITEVRDYLSESISIAIDAGVDREKILVDPGIGFGKSLEHNLTIMNRLDELSALGRPIVLGTSRKKFIGTVLGVEVPELRVDGTAATVALGIDRGARIVRVHDVARMVHVARMTDAIIRQSTTGQTPNHQ